MTNDIFTKEDGEFLVKHGALPEERIRAVETGGCPHAAIREDISINLGPLEELSNLYKADILLCESGGGNLASSLSLKGKTETRELFVSQSKVGHAYVDSFAPSCLSKHNVCSCTLATVHYLIYCTHLVTAPSSRCWINDMTCWKMWKNSLAINIVVKVCVQSNLEDCKGMCT